MLREALNADHAFAEAIWTVVRTGDLTVLPDSASLSPIEWELPERAADSRPDLAAAS